ncbi:hypothetical protein [Microbacterium radiodurans]|uniref:DUF3558 domain-containing protein n=1 Tax=Microbacterium radiodurans TaxID=661398 RepID=A0A5J5ISM7_9MICO|nr:hypothetical protein [Microbacterium radiodurans]KAA9089003.1 hypothetical protein F6B42_00380 [Microbacterium radiodurans]
MTSRPLARLAPAAVLAALVMLAGCAPEPDAAPPSAAPESTPSATATTAAPEAAESAESGGAAPAASGSVVSTTVIPRDCSGLLGSAARTALANVPLNDASFGPSGAMPDGSLRCVWGDPAADTSKIITTISFAEENPVIDFMNGLTSIGFTCYEPDAGVRCEKTWQNDRFPVTDGRTLYFRDGVLVDTQFSHLAPEGYTSGIVASLWPAVPAAPAP